MRSRIIGQGALVGYRVGAAALWLALAVFVAVAGRNESGLLALGPALVLVAIPVGTVLAALVAPFAPVLAITVAIWTVSGALLGTAVLAADRLGSLAADRLGSLGSLGSDGARAPDGGHVRIAP